MIKVFKPLIILKFLTRILRAFTHPQHKILNIRIYNIIDVRVNTPLVDKIQVVSRRRLNVQKVNF